MLEILKVKNLAELKRTVKPGMRIESINHLHNEDKTRKILKVNTVSIISKDYLSNKDDYEFYKEFSEAGIDTDGKMWSTYYTYFEKAKYLRFNQDGSIDFLAHKKPSKDTFDRTMLPSSDFKAGETWLTIKIYK